MSSTSTGLLLRAGHTWLRDVLHLIRTRSKPPRTLCDPLVAYHEAGHAIIAHLLSRPCKLATVRPDGWILGRVVNARHPIVGIDPRMPPAKRVAFRQQLHRNVMTSALISLGGEAAEALRNDVDPRQHALQTFDLRVSDFSKADYQLRLLWHLMSRGGQLSERASREAAIEGVCAAHALLVPNRAALDAVADTLLQRETLGERRLERTIRRNLAAPNAARCVQPGSLFILPSTR